MATTHCEQPGQDSQQFTQADFQGESIYWNFFRVVKRCNA